ncbi:MAG: hypothetical protein Fur0042_19370 [Cyanophyceae cyanobacterium]
MQGFGKHLFCQGTQGRLGGVEMGRSHGGAFLKDIREIIVGECKISHQLSNGAGANGTWRRLLGPLLRIGRELGGLGRCPHP